MTEEVMMIPTKDFENLVQYYKGELTENALLNKTARLAAESHMLLKDKSIPDGIAIARVKPIARERARLTKRLRQHPLGMGAARAPGVGEEEEEEDTGLVTGPLDAMLKQLIKGSPRTPTTPVKAGPSGVKKETTTTAGKPRPSKATPGPSKPTPKPGPSKTRRQEIRKKATEVRKKIQALAGGKKPRKTEAERLKPAEGWEDWAEGKKLQRQLSYDSDEEGY